MATQDRLPTGNSATSGWTSGSAGNKWDDVDDPIASPDDGTTYIYRQNSGGEQLFTYTAFAITSSAISHVRVTFRAQRTVAGECNTGARIRVAGTRSSIGLNANLTTSWADYTRDQLTNPVTGLDWTEAQVEGTDATNPLDQFGLQSGGMAAGEEVQCTQCYITVDYTAAVSDLSREIPADSLTLADNADVARDLEQTIPADGLALSETLDATRDLERTVTDDALTVTDSAQPAMDLRQTLTDDALAVRDSVEATLGILETLATDALKVSESVAAVFDLIESTVVEGVTLADSAEAALAAEPGVDLSVYFTQPGPLLPIMAA